MSFLNSLDRLRPNGKDRWRACCPVHQGSNPTALSIKQCSDGSFLVKCFNCDADGPDVFRSLGLPLDELFGYKEMDRQEGPYITQMMKDQNKEDMFMVAIYEAAQGRNEYIQLSDHKAYKLSVNRMRGYESLLNRNLRQG